jgi:enoyl-[acyl-carrier protein] reductase II
MAAAFALGAEGVQVGSRFVTTHESSAHESFKKTIIDSKEGDTVLTLKKLTPVRMMKNKFYAQVEAAESASASVEELKSLLGRGRAKRGMFEGNLDEGELEIGQVSAQLDNIQPAAEVVNEIWKEFLAVKKEMCEL